MIEGYYIGLISGTSRDGVDAALVLFENDTPKLLHALCLPYGEPLRSDLEAVLANPGPPREAAGAQLDEWLGRHFARAARELAEASGIEMRDVVAIGSHGQTVWHNPGGNPPLSIQLGCPNVMLRSTHRPIVSHFRQADLEAGGEGAPLAPLLHRQLFFSESEHRAVLNLGGIGNLTFLWSGGEVQGFDCGPANCLMDAWIRRHRGMDFDRDGDWAASGEVQSDLLQKMLEDPFFSRQPPKSTGIEYFNMAWLDRHLSACPAQAEDVQCTLAELSALCAAQAVSAANAKITRLLVCGGGVHNQYLMHRLSAALPAVSVESTLEHGLPPDWVEAVLFAWLARERLLERRQDTRNVTGAGETVLLGSITQAKS